MTRASRVALIALYLALACAPLLIAAAPPRPAGRSFWVEVGAAAGFIALGQVTLQFGLVARFGRLSRPFGIDLVMQYHRQMGTLALGIMILHAVVLAAARPGRLTASGSLSSAGILTGFASVATVLLVVLLTVARKRIRLGYEAWRVSHALLSVVALVLAQVHVSVTGLYAATPWKKLALAAYTGTGIALLVYLRLVRPALLLRRPWAVAEIRPEGGSTWTVALTPIGHAGVRFGPGQFGWLKLGGSPWSVDEHPFSFSSSAERRDRVEFAIKELGDFTRAIRSTPVGTRAWIDGPHGSFSSDFHEAPAGFLFVAGGIGIAPIVSILKTLSDRSDRRSHVVVYACTRWDRVSFWNELQVLAHTLRLEIVLVLNEPPEGWSGPRGLITKELLGRFVSVDGATRVAFVCGPDAMMSSVEASLLECGLPARKIHLERFNLA